jgi:hypothetical protein
MMCKNCLIRTPYPNRYECWKKYGMCRKCTRELHLEEYDKNVLQKGWKLSQSRRKQKLLKEKLS